MVLFTASIPEGTQVIETLRFDPDKGCIRRRDHTARLAETCAQLSFLCDLDRVNNLLDLVTGEHTQRVRITVDSDGRIDVGSWPLMGANGQWTVRVYPTRINSRDPWLRVKTTERMLYDIARANLPTGVDEWIFLNEKEEVCEGAITNLFVQTSHGLLTPPLHCGLLPGILRKSLIESGAGLEEIVNTALLFDPSVKLFVGNSLRGLVEVGTILEE